MSATPPRPTHVEALNQFYDAAGLDLVEAKKRDEAKETPQSHTLQTPVSPAKLAAAKESYERLRNTFGESLDLKVGVKDSDEEWTIQYIVINRGEVESEDFEAIGKSGGELDLEINIDKGAVIRGLKVDQARYTCFLYLFEENLVAFLSAPLLDLDDSLFPDNKPVLIVLSQADIHFAGEMLTIVGESTLAADPGLQATLQVQLTPEPVNPTLQEEIQKYLTAASENPSLIGGQFVHLTPLHFPGQWKKENGSALKGIMARHFVNICILYTANRSTFDGEKNALISVYNGVDRTTSLSLQDPPMSEVSTNALESLARWIYEVKGTDRRTVFQNIIAREVYDDDPKTSYNYFITHAPRLLKDAVWQYRVFIDGKITKHFDELQKVIGYVTEINKKISEAIDSVTKSLTDTLLATVGVLVLTVLAALVKKETSIEIFKLSMEIYAAYLVFYAAYRMWSIGDSYRLLSKEASAQVHEYQSALLIEEITDLSSSLRKRRRQFHIWFWLTVILYLALAGSIWWAGKKGPQLLIDRGIIAAPDAKKPAGSSTLPGIHEQGFAG